VSLVLVINIKGKRRMSAVANANWSVLRLCLAVTNLTVAVQYPNGERTADHVTLINVQGFET